MNYSTMDFQSTYNEQFTATFYEKDWRMIVLALQSHVINEEVKLIQSNAGDREWTDLERFNTLANDINLYVLGGKT